MCSRSKAIIPGLLKRINAFDGTMSESITEEIRDTERRAINASTDLKHIKLMLCVVLVIVFVLLVR